MNDVKRKAIETVDELRDDISYQNYSTIMDGLHDIEALRDRDEELEDLWGRFGDVPMNP